MKRIRLALLMVITGFLSPATLLAQVEDYMLEPMVVPVHTQPKQLHLSAGYGDGFGLAGSYSISRALSVFVSGYKNPEAHQVTYAGGGGSSVERDKYGMTGGVGLLLPSKNPEDVFELLVGGGVFSVDNRSYYDVTKPDQYKTTQAEYSKLFIQVNAITTRKLFEVGGLVRLPYNSYKNYQFSEVYRTIITHRGFENVWSLNLEPAFSGTVKWYNVKVNLQVGYSFLMDQSKGKLYYIDRRNGSRVYFEDKSYQPDMEGMIAALSLQYNFNFKSKAEKQP